MKVSNYIKKLYPSLSISYLYKAIRNKDIRINDTRINKDIIVSNGDKINIYISDKVLFNLPDILDIIYEDENVIGIYKPQGILSNIENKNQDEKTLEYLVKNIYKDTKICHRLDRNTAGIVLFSKNDQAYKALLDAFKYGFIKKKYIAYVYGTNFTKEHDILEKFIITDKKNSYSKIFDNNIASSKKIITEYTVIAKNNKLNYSVLEVLIHTGKTHQIRAQLANIGHPIIGDQKYGKNTINNKFKMYKQLLFAYEYKFNFPSKSNFEYLNNTIIKINENYLKIRFGRDKNE